MGITKAQSSTHTLDALHQPQQRRQQPQNVTQIIFGRFFVDLPKKSVGHFFPVTASSEKSFSSKNIKKKQNHLKCHILLKKNGIKNNLNFFLKGLLLFRLHFGVAYFFKIFLMFFFFVFGFVSGLLRKKVELFVFQIRECSHDFI